MKEAREEFSFKLINLDASDDVYNEISVEAAYRDYQQFWVNNGFVEVRDLNIDDL